MKNIIVHTDNNAYTIITNKNKTTIKVVGMLKHLQRLLLRFSTFDNPYSYNIEVATQQLLEYADKFGIQIDTKRLQDQQYLNELHKKYELGFNGQADWLLYHEAIHMCESIKNHLTDVDVRLTYGILSGPLDVKYEWDELITCQSNIEFGDCYVAFSELGKTPYHYWREGEPNNLERLCQLAKPMLRLNFQLRICVNPQPLPADIAEFEAWFSQYREAWCQHWGIPMWTVEQMLGGIKIGTMPKVNEFISNLKDNHVPMRLELVDA
jgi:hypothetical protein